MTREQKSSKIEKFFSEFKILIEEVINDRISKSIPIGFVDIDSKEWVDKNGKMDLEQILTWRLFKIV